MATSAAKGIKDEYARATGELATIREDRRLGQLPLPVDAGVVDLKTAAFDWARARKWC